MVSSKKSLKNLKIALENEFLLEIKDLNLDDDTYSKLQLKIKDDNVKKRSKFYLKIRDVVRRLTLVVFVMLPNATQNVGHT